MSSEVGAQDVVGGPASRAAKSFAIWSSSRRSTGAASLRGREAAKNSPEVSTRQPGCCFNQSASCGNPSEVNGESTPRPPKPRGLPTSSVGNSAPTPARRRRFPSTPGQKCDRQFRIGKDWIVCMNRCSRSKCHRNPRFSTSFEQFKIILTVLV